MLFFLLSSLFLARFEAFYHSNSFSLEIRNILFQPEDRPNKPMGWSQSSQAYRQKQKQNKIRSLCFNRAFRLAYLTNIKIIYHSTNTLYLSLIDKIYSQSLTNSKFGLKKRLQLSFVRGSGSEGRNQKAENEKIRGPKLGNWLNNNSPYFIRKVHL